MRDATRLLIAGVMAVVLAGCGERAADTANTTAPAGFVPPMTAAPTPLPGQEPATTLDAYVGHYPKDAVDGVGFFDRTTVATALSQAVGDPIVRRQIVSGDATQTPIFRQGKRVAAYGCEAHDCAGHNWTLLIDPATGQGEACYHRAASMGDTARWYAGNAPVNRPGGCPSA